MTSGATLIAGDDLKSAALKFLGEMRTKVEREQTACTASSIAGSRACSRVCSFRPAPIVGGQRPRQCVGAPAQDGGLQWDLMRLRLFLDRWRQGRFVEYTQARAVRLALLPKVRDRVRHRRAVDRQGAPSLMRWRGMPLMKNVFDFAMYPALIAECGRGPCSKSAQVSEPARSGSPTTMSFCGVEGRVHSVDRVKAGMQHPGVRFYRATARRLIGCSMPACCNRNRIPGSWSKTPTTMSLK